MNFINPKLLNTFENQFSKPQFNHFQHYISSLIALEKTSIQRFSMLHNRDRSCLNRFLLSSPWKESQIKKTYQNQLSNHISQNSILIIDDCLSRRKYAKNVDKANYHYDHTNGGKSLGYCLVTAVIQDKETTYPYEIRSFYRKCDIKNERHITKNIIASQIILSTKDNSNIDCVTFDSWYSNKIVINACKESKKHYITQIKSDRNVTLSRKEKSVQAHSKMIIESDWEYLNHNDQSFRYFATSAFISKIGTVHLIFCQMYDLKKEKWGETHYIISDMLNIQSHKIITSYLTRSKIESFHREAKQNLGLEGYIYQRQRVIERHLLLLLIAYGLLVIQNLHLAKTNSMGEMCERIKIELFIESFDKIQSNPHLKRIICRNLAKARV